MMRTICAAALLVTLCGIGVCDKRGDEILDQYAQALKKAKTLSYTETLKARVGQDKYDTYTAKVALAKPNMFRIELDTGEVLACDGKKIYEYSPAKKVCLVCAVPESMDGVRGHFGGLRVFSPWIFYNPEPTETLRNRVEEATAEHSIRSDEPCSTVLLKLPNNVVSELTLSDASHMVRSHRYYQVSGDTTVLYREGERKDVVTDGPTPVSAFAFVPKSGVEMVELPKLDGDVLAAGEKAPDFTAKTVDGKPFQLSKLRGKVVLIDFWATWCGPCMRALPETNEIAKEYAGADFVAVGLNVWDEQEAMEKFVAENDYKLTFVREPGSRDDGMAGLLYQVSGIPTLYIIDKEGKIAKGFIGFDPENNPKAIREVLAGLGLKPKEG
jgi:thiol-disulfide isomerase/thioredoxin/outer membrane lipoprotein-sorting protein